MSSRRLSTWSTATDNPNVTQSAVNSAGPRYGRRYRVRPRRRQAGRPAHHSTWARPDDLCRKKNGTPETRRRLARARHTHRRVIGAN